MTYDLAPLSLCALGPSFGAHEAMSVNAFDTVLITGAGPVGLGAVVNAVHRGAKRSWSSRSHTGWTSPEC
jgi:L-iditol 2-dehydrogenase